MEFLLKEIERIENKVSTLKTEIYTEIKEVEKRLNIELSNIKTEVNEINAKLKNTVVGGAKLEALGVLNISYGIIIPLIQVA